ncbi:MAG: AMP-binding protein, partial [Verrucomicrobiales bacterium]|nr:AMP-binding protein [Verrucomicrobiales bacterium]
MAKCWQVGSGVSGFLSAQAYLTPDEVFLEDRHGNVLTYSATAEMAKRFAGYLQSKGVKRGDRVAIHLQNRVELVVALFATAMLGGIYVVLHSKLRPTGLAKILEQAEARVIVLDEVTHSNLDAASGGLIPVIVGRDG